MSNIAGKAYAMNVVTPVPWYWVWAKKLIFWLMVRPPLNKRLAGLETLSLIHYARWVIVKPSQFPRLSEEQPRESLKYSYFFFFSNFNGSWLQYIDSFSSAIPHGLDWFWKWSVRYTKSVPMQPFHEHILANQIWTEHYYSAYPMASSNDVKSARHVKFELLTFMGETKAASADEFKVLYDNLLLELQHDLGQMAPSPVVSLSAAAVEDRRRNE